MRSLLAGAALVGVLALSGASPPPADHALIFGGVNIYRGTGPVVAEYGSQYIPCTGTSCAVTVAIGKRDYGRFVKWCGAASQAIIVSPGSFGNHVECQGPKPWYAQAHVGMHNAQDVLTTHAEAVTITVTVTP
jgi:hypothetical protein